MADLWGVLLGGALTLAGGFAAKIWDEWRERRALRAAFRAEIAGLLNVGEMRKHEERLKGWVAAWEKGEDLRPTMHGVPADDDPVFSKNVDKIGVLGSEAENVVRFYFMLRALRVHFRAIEGGRVGEMPVERRIEFVNEAIAVGQRWRSIGEDLAKRL